jgi:hypothetical protein
MGYSLGMTAAFETFGLPEDPWDELIHQGDVDERSVAAVPRLLAALEAGTHDDAGLLYLLAAMCVGRPERAAATIRDTVRPGTELLKAFLPASEEDVRAGAVGALAAAEAVDDETADRLADLARRDDAAVVRAHAMLGLGLFDGPDDPLLERMAEDEDPTVRHAAALALAHRGHTDERVVGVHVDALLDAGEHESPTERPPWDALYPDWTAELTAIGPAAVIAIPRLVEELPRLEPWLAVDVAAIALELTREDEDLRSDVLRALVDADPPWKRRLELGARLEEEGLPPARDDLRRRIAGLR